MSYFKKYQGGLLVSIYVQPGAKLQGISGLHGQRLKVRLQAPPTDNLANEQLLEFLADILKLQSTTIKILKGHKSRNKEVFVVLSEEDFIKKLQPYFKKV